MVVLTNTIKFEKRTSDNFPINALVKYLANDGKIYTFKYFGKNELEASINCIDMLHALYHDGNLEGCEEVKNA